MINDGSYALKGWFYSGSIYDPEPQNYFKSDTQVRYPSQTPSLAIVLERELAAG